ncbi:hypothetical protein HMPREF0970_01921 [Schaalia odontolytica F0309]|uniref:Uncharacterized protein n=1 Tax=Schaalia odontolytica F0309 TaxID=649742 RepID=D4U122_9ACTO|nr:hypothetical protein HMPREF0970_01921 [Schaalia odontolytica F0309]
MQGSGRLCRRSSSCAVARDADCGLSEPFGVDAQRWGTRDAKAGGSWSREVQMDSFAQKVMKSTILQNLHCCWSSVFDLLCRKFNWVDCGLVFSSLYMQIKAVWQRYFI